MKYSLKKVKTKSIDVFESHLMHSDKYSKKCKHGVNMYKQVQTCLPHWNYTFSKSIDILAGHAKKRASAYTSSLSYKISLSAKSLKKSA